MQFRCDHWPQGSPYTKLENWNWIFELRFEPFRQRINCDCSFVILSYIVLFLLFFIIILVALIYVFLLVNSALSLVFKLKYSTLNCEQPYAVRLYVYTYTVILQYSTQFFVWYLYYFVVIVIVVFVVFILLYKSQLA